MFCLPYASHWSSLFLHMRRMYIVCTLCNCCSFHWETERESLLYTEVDHESLVAFVQNGIFIFLVY